MVERVDWSQLQPLLRDLDPSWPTFHRPIMSCVLDVRKGVIAVLSQIGLLTLCSEFAAESGRVKFGLAVAVVGHCIRPGKIHDTRTGHLPIGCSSIDRISLD